LAAGFQWPGSKAPVPLTEPTEVASPAQLAADDLNADPATQPSAAGQVSPRAPGAGYGTTQPGIAKNPAPAKDTTVQIPNRSGAEIPADGGNRSPVASLPPSGGVATGQVMPQQPVASASSATPGTPAPQSGQPAADPADDHGPIRPAGISVTGPDGAIAPPPSVGQTGPTALTDLVDHPVRQTVVISPGAVTVTTSPSAFKPLQTSAGADSRPAATSAPASRPSPAPGDGNSRIITAPMVQVNARYISVDDVYRGAYERAEAVSTLLPKHDYMTAMKKVVQDELNIRIHDCLIIGEAEKKLSDEEKKDVDKEMEETLAEMVADTGTKAKLEEKYIQRGMTLDDVLKDQRQRVTIRAFLRSHFAGELVVGRKALYEYFTGHKGEFSTPLKVQMQIISSPIEAFLPKAALARDASPAELKVAKEDARRNIELAQKALGEGKDFDQVAKDCSKDAHAKDGGIWPTMPRGSLKESKIEEAAFTQTQGQVSGIIPADSGYYLVKTRKIVEASEQTFEAVQDKIEAHLRDEHYRKVTDDYLDKLYQGATISHTQELIDTVCMRLMNVFAKS
jgi:hypothetical protein